MNFNLAVTLMFFLSFGSPQGARSPVTRISGSPSMLSLTHRLTTWYSERNAGVHFQVDVTNATQGFSSLIDGSAAVAQTPRKALEGEVLALRTHRKLEFVELPVATEFAVIAVNSENP